MARLLNTLDVVWTFDSFIRPPGPKMVVCVEPELGYFYRINGEDKWQRGVHLAMGPVFPFLTKDSFLECGNPVEIDDYIIEQSIASRGVIGQLDRSVVPLICRAIENYGRISKEYRSAISRALGCP